MTKYTLSSRAQSNIIGKTTAYVCMLPKIKEAFRKFSPNGALFGREYAYVIAGQKHTGQDTEAELARARIVTQDETFDKPLDYPVIHCIVPARNYVGMSEDQIIQSSAPDPDLTDALLLLAYGMIEHPEMMKHDVDDLAIEKMVGEAAAKQIDEWKRDINYQLNLRKNENNKNRRPLDKYRDNVGLTDRSPQKSAGAKPQKKRKTDKAKANKKVPTFSEQVDLNGRSVTGQFMEYLIDPPENSAVDKETGQKLEQPYHFSLN